VLVVNKTDCAPDAADELPVASRALFAHVVSTSAARCEGIAGLEAAVAAALGMSGAGPQGAAWAANRRQAEALEQAAAALQRLETTVLHGLPLDFWTIELREAALALGLITGADVGEDVLSDIFSRFCMGK